MVNLPASISQYGQSGCTIPIIVQPPHHFLFISKHLFQHIRVPRKLPQKLGNHILKSQGHNSLIDRLFNQPPLSCSTH